MFTNIFSWQNWFLVALAVVWSCFAIIQDFRKREVANWWSFSFIAIVLVSRSFLSIHEKNWGYISWGLIGLLAGFVLANIFYYARMFAAGDAKFMIGFIAVIPFSFILKENLMLLLIFLFSFLIAGSIYGAIYSFVLGIIHRKTLSKEFKRQFLNYKQSVLIAMIAGLVLIILAIAFNQYFWASFCILIMLSPLLLIYAKATEESCMNKFVLAKELTIGDWIVKPLKSGRDIIRPNWEGLDEKQLKQLQKHPNKKVLVKYGIPFTPTFLLGLVLMLVWIKFRFLL